MSGASGLIGTALGRELAGGGHAVARLVRREPRGPDEFAWDPPAGTIDHAAFDGADAVIHLAGEPIAERRWSGERQRRILESRTSGTRLIAEGMAAALRPPAVLISASAIGIYGDRGDELLDERSTTGDDFLARVCQAWEHETGPAARTGARVVLTRFGLVLSRRGGALARQLPFFRAGIGGRIGSGRQWMSCVAISDLTGALLHILSRSDMTGPVNVVCPAPMRNADYTRLLGRLLHRPAVLPVPGAALRILFGGLADAALLSSQRVIPSALTAAGYRFRHASIESALRAALIGKDAG